MDSTKTIEIANQTATASLNFKPDGPCFVAADGSGSLRQWSVKDGAEVNMPGMKVNGRINAVVVSADGQWIVSGGSGNKVTVWSTVTHRMVIEVAEHTKAIRALDISSDSSRFASGSGDNTARIFGITSGIRLVPPLQHPNTVVGVKFSPRGCRIATITHTSPFVGVYDTRTGEKLFEIPVAARWTPITPLAWSTDGQLLFAASPGKITCLDISTMSSLSEWPIHDNSKQVSIVTSGKFIACSAGSSVSFWDSTSHKQIGHIINYPTAINCIGISHDARYLACGHDAGITVYSLQGFLPSQYLHAATGGVARLPCLSVPLELQGRALESWIQGNPTETEAILSDEIAKCSNPSYVAFATRAFIRSHLGEWGAALEDAETSLQIKQSPIGQIARFTALVGVGEQAVALDELDLVFCNCNQSDIQFLLVINSILLFMCDKRKQAVSRLLRFIDASDDEMKDVYLQVLGMMYLKQGDYENAVQMLVAVGNPFTIKEHGCGALIAIFIMFNWNFENLESIAWQRLCETLYASGSVKAVGDALIRMVNPLLENEKEPAHGHILQEIITRSGEVTLLAWTGKSSMCNSCLPSSPAVYAQTSAICPSPALQGEALRERAAQLRAIVPLVDALMTYGSVTRSQPVRFAHFRLLLPCIVFSVKTLKKDKEGVYRAETVGHGDVEFTTADALPLKEPRKLVFVNPWIHHLHESHSRGTRNDESDTGSSTHVRGSADTDMDADAERVHETMVEEALSFPGLDTDAHTRALQLIARLGQPFVALLLLRQPDGAYKRVAADHEIILCGIGDDVLRDICIEVLEIL